MVMGRIDQAGPITTDRLRAVSRTERARLAELRSAVDVLFRSNRQQGHAGWCDRDYDYVCPSPDTYPFQWFWDSCFHAIVLSRFDPARAATELRTLLANQFPDGFVSHMTLWQQDLRDMAQPRLQINWRTPWQSDAMQPPLLAEALAAVVQRGGQDRVLHEFLPPVRAYYDWCQRVRDIDGSGLLVVFEPHETGMDQSPAFDAYMEVDDLSAGGFEAAWRSIAQAQASVGRDPSRMVELDRFMVVDVLVNAVYADNQRILADLLGQAGDDAGAAEMRARAERTAAALVSRCWSEADHDFHALAGRDAHRLPGGSVAGLVDCPEPIVVSMVRRLEDEAEFGARFPIPSIGRSHPAFSPEPVGNLLWRGPTWINTNWLVARGLRRSGRADLARRIEDASLALVERSGFREYYNPLTGAGHGARDHAWSALVLDVLAARVEGDDAASP
jgi:Glycosyl hydrolase family 63 C-terminal domain